MPAQESTPPVGAGPDNPSGRMPENDKEKKPLLQGEPTRQDAGKPQEGRPLPQGEPTRRDARKPQEGEPPKKGPKKSGGGIPPPKKLSRPAPR